MVTKMRNNKIAPASKPDKATSSESVLFDEILTGSDVIFTLKLRQEFWVGHFPW